MAATETDSVAATVVAAPGASTNSVLSESSAASCSSTMSESAVVARRGPPAVEVIPNACITGRPECRIIIYNVAKKQNVGNIVRSAVAMGVSRMIIVGNRKINTFGNKNTNRFIRFDYFDKLEDCHKSLKAEGFEIIGVEIGSTSRDVGTRPFTSHTAFVFGNEGTGLNDKVLGLCDKLVYIPQYSSGTASLNVSCAAGIILYEFAKWAEYKEAERTGDKYVVDSKDDAVDGSPRAAKKARTDDVTATNATHTNTNTENAPRGKGGKMKKGNVRHHQNAPRGGPKPPKPPKAVRLAAQSAAAVQLAGPTDNTSNTAPTRPSTTSNTDADVASAATDSSSSRKRREPSDSAVAPTTA